MMPRSPIPILRHTSAILLAAVLPLAACGGSSEPDPDGDPVESSTEPDAPPEPVIEPVLSLADRCPSFSAYEAATEYTADGPHPITLFANRADSINSFHTFAQDAMPDEWTREHANDVQLVGCVNIIDGDEELATCDYTFGVAGTPPVYVPLHDRQYRIVVYEARTGRQVTNLKIDARSDECPESWMTDFDEFGDPLPMHTAVTDEELADGLEAVVTGPVM